MILDKEAKIPKHLLSQQLLWLCGHREILGTLRAGFGQFPFFYFLGQHILPLVIYTHSTSCLIEVGRQFSSLLTRQRVT